MLLEHVQQDSALSSQSTGHSVAMSVANSFYIYSILACVRTHSCKDVSGNSVEWMIDSAHWASQSGCWYLCFFIMRSMVSIQIRRLSIHTKVFKVLLHLSRKVMCLKSDHYHFMPQHFKLFTMLVHLHLHIAVTNFLKGIKNRTDPNKTLNIA